MLNGRLRWVHNWQDLAVVNDMRTHEIKPQAQLKHWIAETWRKHAERIYEVRGVSDIHLWFVLVTPTLRSVYR
jgi:hypothetical protein